MCEKCAENVRELELRVHSAAAHRASVSRSDVGPRCQPEHVDALGIATHEDNGHRQPSGQRRGTTEAARQTSHVGQV